MRNIAKTFLFSTLLCGTIQASAQSFRDYVNKAESSLNNGNNTKNHSQGNSGNSGSFSNLSNTDITGALRQALQVGTKNAADRLSAPNGFFGNSLIKILMPPEARNAETTLRGLGFGEQVDNAILSMNRAAEDAAEKAVPIFVNAITSMSIQDGLAILQGGSDAATQYLKAKTSAALTAAFRPVIEQSLSKVNATKYWTKVFTVYNELPTTFNKVNPDLPAYVTERALNGLFVSIAEEEGKIRQNPAARTTSLLQKVFGAH